MKPIAPLAAALTLAAAPIGAQQTDGTVTGTLDFEERVWNVAGADAERPSGWQETEGALEARIRAIPGASASETAGPSEILTLSFTARQDGTTPEAEDLRVTLTGGAEGDLSAAPANTDITLNALSVEGTDMIVAGSFVAVLTPGDTEELVAADAEGAVTLDGNFQATIEQQAE
ncbi:hypothetical protein [Roseovarius aquimarinus]|uniref:Uncharacterized protein n=1 Tax=Roseovarius aquimarinus TaxID=1229156 RepID=A0ABW7IAQ8_9RHOB